MCESFNGRREVQDNVSVANTYEERRFSSRTDFVFAPARFDTGNKANINERVFECQVYVV